MLYTASELDRIHTLAREQAHTLREQAMADFWRGADALVAHASHSASRSAQRLAYRLARRAHVGVVQAQVQAVTPVSIPTTPCEGA